jgi:hypothetical protein
VVWVDGERAQRCPKVSHDVSLDVGHIEVWLGAGGHPDQSTLQNDLVSHHFHGPRDDASLPPRAHAKDPREEGRSQEQQLTPPDDPRHPLTQEEGALRSSY